MALAGGVSGLRVVRLKRRERALGGDTGLPVVDVVFWAEAAAVTGQA